MLVAVCNAIRFLLFREEHPKHRVIGDMSLIESVWYLHGTILFGVVATLWAIYLAFIHFGGLGAILAYLGISVLLLEIPHCIFDR